MEKFDYDRNGCINFSEFIIGTLDSNTHLSEHSLKYFFNYLDPHRLGYLTVCSLQKAFQHSNKYFTNEELCEMIKECGIDPTEKITFGMFCRLIKESLDE